MRHYKHLTFTDRLKIEKMRKEKCRVQEIADALHVHYSTIYRELKRGTYTHMNTDLTTETRYSPDIAQQAYEATFALKGPALKIGNDHNLANFIEYKILHEHYSPAAVLGEIKAMGLEFDTTICLRTLYSYIDKGVFLHLTNKHLPQKGKRKKPRPYKQVRPARAPKGTSIEKRPKEINERSVFGHWEMDTVHGRKRTKKSLLVLTERVSRAEIIRPIKDRTSQSVNRALDGIERKYGDMFKKVFLSITVDNGSEFADHETLERSIYGGTRTQIYYCHPYSSWERGSNENQNGLIRRHHPNGTNFSRVTNKEIARTEEWINHYPREMFGWKSAADKFAECLARL